MGGQRRARLAPRVRQTRVAYASKSRTGVCSLEEEFGRPNTVYEGRYAKCAPLLYTPEFHRCHQYVHELSVPFGMANRPGTFWDSPQPAVQHGSLESTRDASGCSGERGSGLGELGDKASDHRAGLRFLQSEDLL